MPLDEHEAQDRATTLRVSSIGRALFRIARPATPDKHLCVWRMVLLVDHAKA